MSSRLAGSPTTAVETDVPDGLDATRLQEGSPNGEAGVPRGADTDDHGQLNARRDAPVGGQAVLEGVMMRGVSHWAVAVRKPSAAQLDAGERAAEEPALGEVEVSTFPLDSVQIGRASCRERV